MMKIINILNDADKKMEFSNIESHFYESRAILEFVINKNKEWIAGHIMDEISDAERDDFFRLVEKRVSGMPLQYILGHSCFMGYDFFVDENVLIPRSDTEVWVEKVIKMIKNSEEVSILDMCTGSGCIAITLKKILKNINVTGVDVSENALNVARKNAVHNDVKVEFICSNLFDKLTGLKFDVIVSNPPYIPTQDVLKLQIEVQNEPKIALDGGIDGLDFYRKIITDSKMFLKDNGILALEIGFDQADKVKEILIDNKFENIELINDYSGNNRALLSK